jgi:hypothetical protein
MPLEVANKLQQLRAGINSLVSEHVGEGGKKSGGSGSLSEEGNIFVEAIGELLLLEQGKSGRSDYGSGGRSTQNAGHGALHSLPANAP